MAYYVVHQTTNELLYLSDFEPPNSFVAEGHHVYESALLSSEIYNKYDWIPQENTFVLKSTKLTKRNFIKLFTVNEYASIRQAATQNAALDYYWQLFMLAEYIDLADQDTIAGIHMLEAAGLIAAGRAEEILNG